MKKYIKPAIEEIQLEVYSPIADSYNSIGIYGGTTEEGGYINPTGGVDDEGNETYGQWAPGKKGSSDEDFGW